MARYLKKKEKKSHTLIWLLGILIAAVMIVILIFVNRPQPLNTDTIVETPYCTLSYPDKWASQVRIEITESPVYRVSYYAVLSGKEDIKLFDITFGEETANPEGQIRMKNGEMAAVCVSASGLEKKANWTEEEWNIVQEMMDDLNYILERIPFTSALEETEPTQTPTTEAVSFQDILIDTPYGQLTYPGKWQDSLDVTHVQGDAYVVTFSALVDSREAQPLFDIVFSDEVQLGVLDVNGQTVGVSLTLHDFVPDSSWQTEQIETITSMQEDVNYLISQLNLQDASQFSSEETELQDDSQEEAPPEESATPETETTTPTTSAVAEIVIETPYGQLKYPGKWVEQIHTEVTETDVYIVAFYGTVGAHEEVHLFSVCFGDDSEVSIGTVQDNSGNSVTFSILPSNFSPGANWSREESDRIYEMMEDVNYLISDLLEA